MFSIGHILNPRTPEIPGEWSGWYQSPLSPEKGLYYGIWEQVEVNSWMCIQLLGWFNHMQTSRTCKSYWCACHLNTTTGVHLYNSEWMSGQLLCLLNPPSAGCGRNGRINICVVGESRGVRSVNILPPTDQNVNFRNFTPWAACLFACISLPAAVSKSEKANKFSFIHL